MRFNIWALAGFAALAAAKDTLSVSQLEEKITTLKTLCIFTSGVAAKINTTNFDQYAKSLITSSKEIIQIANMAHSDTADNKGKQLEQRDQQGSGLPGLGSLGGLEKDAGPKGLNGLLGGILDTRAEPGSDKVQRTLASILHTFALVLSDANGVSKRADSENAAVNKRDPQTRLLHLLPEIPTLSHLGIDSKKMAKRQYGADAQELADDFETIDSILETLTPQGLSYFLDRYGASLNPTKRSEVPADTTADPYEEVGKGLHQLGQLRKISSMLNEESHEATMDLLHGLIDTRAASKSLGELADPVKSGGPLLGQITPAVDEAVALAEDIAAAGADDGKKDAGKVKRSSHEGLLGSLGSLGFLHGDLDKGLHLK